MKDVSNTWVVTENSLKILDDKKNRNIVIDLSKKPVEHKDPKNINWTWPS